jgi:hypothetical protein
MGDVRFEPSAYEFARLAINSLITSCGGALIALMAFAGQQPHMTAAAVSYFGLSAGWLGAALMFALLSVTLSYANQAFLAWGTGRPYLRWVAVAVAVASLGSLAIGGVLALQMVLSAHR